MSVTVLEATQRQLEADLARVCGHLNVLHAELVAIVERALTSGAWAGQGLNSAGQWLAWQTGLSPERARQIVAIAARTQELPCTFAAFAEGALAVDQVAVVAARTPAHNDAEVCELARSATVAQLRSSLTKHFLPDPPTPDGKSDPEPATEPSHRVTAGFNNDGDFYLHGLANGVDGALIDQALCDARDSLFAAGQTGVTTLDALMEICRRSLGTITSPSRLDLYRIFVHLDTEGAWVHQGPAIPPSLLDRLTCDGIIQPVWETDGLPINVGRAQRIFPLRTRRMVENRDKTCVHPHCNSRKNLEVHHIIHWRDGGTTDTSNACAMCDRHHDKHHRGEFTITGNADIPGDLTFRDRNGHIIEPCGQPQPPAGTPPPHPAVPYKHPTGERLYLRWLYFKPAPDADQN